MWNRICGEDQPGSVIGGIPNDHSTPFRDPEVPQDDYIAYALGPG